LAENAKGVDPPDRSFGIILTPEEEKPITRSYEYFVMRLKSVGDFGAVWLAIIECVDYIFAFGPPDHHQAIQIYDLFRATSSPSFSVGFVIGKSVPAQDWGWGISFITENLTTSHPVFLRAAPKQHHSQPNYRRDSR
jgi:hypothetical protein